MSKTFKVVLLVIFGIVALLLSISYFWSFSPPASESTGNPNEQITNSPSTSELNDDQDGQFTKILTVVGNTAKQSEEFAITSNNIKIIYTCDDGTFVCTARLRQVAGELNKEVFRGSGSTGTVSGEKSFATGPGQFYLTIDTEGRNYRIEVFQQITPASQEKITAAETQVTNTTVYRNIPGYELIDEAIFDDYAKYSYQKTDDRRYMVQLYPVTQTEKVEFESDFGLDENQEMIGSVGVRYSYEKQISQNGVELSLAYENLQFIFENDGKSYTGFINRDDSTRDKEGLLSVMKHFVNTLILAQEGQ